MWFVIVMALGGVANHVLSPNAGHGMGYLAIAVQFGFAFAFPVRLTATRPVSLCRATRPPLPDHPVGNTAHGSVPCVLSLTTLPAHAP
jgi:hypothetical protein